MLSDLCTHSTANQQPGHGQRASHPLPQRWTNAVLLWYQVKCTKALRKYHTESAVMCHVVELCRSCVCGWISCMGHPHRPTHRCCFTASLRWFSGIIKTAYYAQTSFIRLAFFCSLVFSIPLLTGLYLPFSHAPTFSCSPTAKSCRSAVPCVRSSSLRIMTSPSSRSMWRATGRCVPCAASSSP